MHRVASQLIIVFLLCALIPSAGMAEFSQFNDEEKQLLKSWGLKVDQNGILIYRHRIQKAAQPWIPTQLPRSNPQNDNLYPHLNPVIIHAPNLHPE